MIYGLSSRPRSTAGDIADMLALSQETVVFHLKTVMQKVGV